MKRTRSHGGKSASQGAMLGAQRGEGLLDEDGLVGRIRALPMIIR